jgi:hypothetical protein
MKRCERSTGGNSSCGGCCCSLCVLSFALEAVGLSFDSVGEVVRVIHSVLKEHFLQLCWSWLSCAFRHFENGGRLRSHGAPLVEFLSKEVGLKRQQDFGTFNLPKVKTLSISFGRRGKNRGTES